MKGQSILMKERILLSRILKKKNLYSELGVVIKFLSKNPS